MITIYETADAWRVVKGPHSRNDETLAGAVERRYLTTEDALMVETREGIREALRDIQCDEISAERRAKALK